MTDEIAALTGLTNFDCPQRENAISHFYEKWKNEELVLDKWFMSQALSRLPNTLVNVKSLIGHKGFNFQNPNKVRSLIGAFCLLGEVWAGQNSVSFNKDCIYWF